MALVVCIEVAIELFVVNQRLLPFLDLPSSWRYEADSPSPGCVLNGLLAAIQITACLLNRSDIPRGGSGDGIARPHVGDVAVPNEIARSDCPTSLRFRWCLAESCLMISCVEVSEIHDYRDLYRPLVRQYDSAHGPTVNAPTVHRRRHPSRPHCRMRFHWYVELNRYCLPPMMKTRLPESPESQQ